jgi:hypothetical protein
MLQERRPHAVRRDQVTEFALVVNRGEDRCLRKGARDVREDAFGAATLIEIVVNEGRERRCGAGRFDARTGQLICDFPRGTMSATVNLRRYI